MTKIKTVHIHTDLKFIGETSLFDGAHFKNQIIVIGDEKTYQGPYTGNLNFVKRNYFGLKKMIRICNRSDMVILYDLDPIKSAIANSVSDHVKIAWRFFGYELYKRNKEKYISTESIGTITEESNFSFIHSLICCNLFSPLNPVNLFFDSSFLRAVSRIDYFLCLSRMEYNELLKEWPELPECIEISFWDVVKACQPIELWKLKQPVLILGNNRSIYNNHLDVFKELEANPGTSDYQIIVPFSYGSEGDYAQAVRHKVKEMSKYSLLEDFLPYQEYNAVIRRSYALIINSYRQIGMDTIFIAIEGGVKVYLNPKNITYTWFKSKGFKIFDINSLVPDLEAGKIRLSISEIEYNLRMLHDLQESYSKEDFQNIIVEKVWNRD